MRRLNETRSEPGELATASPRTAFHKVGSNRGHQVTPLKKVLEAKRRSSGTSTYVPLIITAVFQIRIHWFRIRIQHFGWTPIRNWKKCIDKKNLIFFWSKIAIYLSLGLQKDVQATEEAFSPQKRHPALQNLKCLNFYIFVDPDSESGSWIRIRIRIHWPDLISIQYGSRSETMIISTRTGYPTLCTISDDGSSRR